MQIKCEQKSPAKIDDSPSVLPQNAPLVTIHPLAGDQEGALVSIHPPDRPSDPQTRKTPVDIVLVIDVSSSMRAAAPPPPDASSTEMQHGEYVLNVLDLAKHAAHFIIETLDENDRLGIVIFSTTAEVRFALTTMSPGNKERVLEVVEALEPDGATALWPAIEKGLVMLEKEPNTPDPRIPGLMVLTDGQPNEGNPAEGYVSVLCNKKKYNKKPVVPINIFGFSTRINEGLMSSITDITDGRFAYISDPGMMGTVFIHATAQLQATYAHRGTLRVEFPSDIKLKHSVGLGVRESFNQISTGNNLPGCLVFENIDLRFGQSRDFYFTKIHAQRTKKEKTDILTDIKMEDTDNSLPPCMMKASFRYTCPGREPATVIAVADLNRLDTAEQLPEADVVFHQMRSIICDYISGLFRYIPSEGLFRRPCQDFDTPYNTVKARLEACAQQAHTANGGEEHLPCAALLMDFTGQVALAVVQYGYRISWGLPYLLHLRALHDRQERLSFRDPGTQTYNAHNEFFSQCVARLDKAHNSCPPLSGRGKKHINVGGGAGTGGIEAPVNPVNMRRYNNPAAGCFGRDTPVWVLPAVGDDTQQQAEESQTLTRKLIKDLRRGDRVLGLKGPRQVVGVLATWVEKAYMYRLGQEEGGLVTAWHPLLVTSSDSGDQRRSDWVHPAEHLKDRVLYEKGFVYTPVLEPEVDPDAHSIKVGENNGQCFWGVTLGHGLTSSPPSGPGGSDSIAKQEDVRLHPYLGDYSKILADLEIGPTGAEGQDDNGLRRCLGVNREGSEGGRISGFIVEKVSEC